MNTTIQITRHAEIIEERTATTKAGARRSLLAAVRRHTKAAQVESVDRQHAEAQALAWTGGDVQIVIPDWNRAGSTVIAVLAS